MLILDVLGWWYTRGWAYVVRRMNYRLDWVLETFSVTALLSTLFAPFRQTDIGGSGGPISLKIRAAIDKLISRIIGFLVRLILLLAALILLILTLALNFVIFSAWVFIPFLPVIGLIFTALNFSFDLNWLFHLHFNLHLWQPHIPGGYHL